MLSQFCSCDIWVITGQLKDCLIVWNLSSIIKLTDVIAIRGLSCVLLGFQIDVHVVLLRFPGCDKQCAINNKFARDYLRFVSNRRSSHIVMMSYFHE